MRLSYTHRVCLSKADRSFTGPLFNPLKIAFLLLLLLTSHKVFSLGKIDSLLKIWNDPSQADTNRLRAIGVVCKEGYLYSNPDSAIYFAQQAIDFARKKNLKKYEALCISVKGGGFYLKGDFIKAMDLFRKSLDLYEEIKDKEGIANSLSNMGNVYNEQGDNARAIDFFIRCLKIREERGDKQSLPSSLSNIGVVYWDMGDKEKAMQYFLKSLEQDKSVQDKKNTANVYNNIAEIYKAQGQFRTSLEYLNKSLKIREAEGDELEIAASLLNIGDVYLSMGDLTRALDYQRKSLKIAEEMGDKVGQALSLLNIGIIFQKENKITAATGYAKHSLLLAKETGNVTAIRDASKILFETYKKTKKNVEALQMHELYVLMKDSIISDESKREVLRHELQYNYEKQKALDEKEHEKQLAIAELKSSEETNKRKLQLSLFSAIILMSGGGAAYWNKRNQSKLRELHLKAALHAEEIKRKNIEAELKLQHEKERISRDLHDSVGSQLTYIISQLDYTSVLSGENENLQAKIHNLSDNARELMQMLREIIWAIQKEELSLKDFSFKIKELLARYQGSFPETQFHFELSDLPESAVTLKPAQLLNLFRIIQEGVNNAIKHASAKNISVVLKLDAEGHLQMLIEDDGLGLPDKMLNDTQYGLKNMRIRTEEMQGVFNIFSSKDKGAQIKVTVGLS